MTTPKKIEVVYAWIVTEKDGSEGIPAQLLTHGPLGGTFAPLIGADMQRIESARHSPAMEAVRKQKLPHRLVRFEVQTVLENYP